MNYYIISIGSFLDGQRTRSKGEDAIHTRRHLKAAKMRLRGGIVAENNVFPSKSHKHDNASKHSCDLKLAYI